MNKIKEVGINTVYNSSFSIPASIFSTKLSPLESLVKFLRENYGWNFNQIGKVIGRDSRNMSAAYRKVKHIRVAYIDIGYSIPLDLFSDKRMSILEHVVNHLHNEGIGCYKIANLLNKNTSSIYTVKKRASEKLNTEDVSDKLKDVVKYLDDVHKLNAEEISKLLKIPKQIIERLQEDNQ